MLLTPWSAVGSESGCTEGVLKGTCFLGGAAIVAFLAIANGLAAVLGVALVGIATVLDAAFVGTATVLDVTVLAAVVTTQDDAAVGIALDIVVLAGRMGD